MNSRISHFQSNGSPLSGQNRYKSPKPNGRNHHKKATKFNISGNAIGYNGSKPPKKFDFLRDDWGDAAVEKSEPLLNPVFSTSFIHESQKPRVNKLKDRVLDFMREKSSMLNELWERYDVPEAQRNQITSSTYISSSSRATHPSLGIPDRDGRIGKDVLKEYKEMSKEMLRVLGQRPLIRGLIDQREEILIDFKNLKNLELNIKNKEILIEKIQIYRTVSLYIIENIEKWRSPESGRDIYYWEGQDYFLKMISDFCEMVKFHKPLLVVFSHLKYSITPLALPYNTLLYLPNQLTPTKRNFNILKDKNFRKLKQKYFSPRDHPNPNPVLPSQNKEEPPNSFFITQGTSEGVKTMMSPKQPVTIDSIPSSPRLLNEEEGEGEEEKFHWEELKFSNPNEILNRNKIRRKLKKLRNLEKINRSKPSITNLYKIKKLKSFMNLQHQKLSKIENSQLTNKEDIETNQNEQTETETPKKGNDSKKKSKSKKSKNTDKNKNSSSGEIDFSSDDDEDDMEEEKFSSLRDVTKLPNLLIFQKYNDIFQFRRIQKKLTSRNRHRFMKYQNPLLQLRHDDLLSQIENGRSLESKRRLKKLKKKNKALRETFDILKKIKKNRGRRKREELSNSRYHHNLQINSVLDDEILQEKKEIQSEKDNRKKKIGGGVGARRRRYKKSYEDRSRAMRRVRLGISGIDDFEEDNFKRGGDGTKLTNRKKQVKSKYIQRRMQINERKRRLKFRKPKVQDEFERLQKAELVVIKHFKFTMIQNEFEKKRKMELSFGISNGKYTNDFSKKGFLPDISKNSKYK